MTLLRDLEAEIEDNTLYFRCPHCQTVLWIPFVGAVAWERTGDTIDSITVRPSINAMGHGHWYIDNGDIHDVDLPAPTPG